MLPLHSLSLYDLVIYICTCFSLSIATSHAVDNPSTFELPIYFPSSRPYMLDLYLCTSISLKNVTSPGSSLYIESFTPVADMFVVHHMLLYGCTVPGKQERMWDCGGMLSSGTSSNHRLPVADICTEGTPRILYAWARNAPRLILPKNVGFQIGGNTGINSLVLQFHTGNHPSGGGSPGSDQHYGRNKKNDEVVDVGVILHVGRAPTPKLAGVYLLASSGFIPAMSRMNLEMACVLEENKEIHPFAYRTHSHSLGKVISGYRVRRNVAGGFEWTLIGKKDPQLPQMFYPVKDESLVVRQGDILAARCTMESNRQTVTYIGRTAQDEMCNFYMMYYVNTGKTLENEVCYAGGPNLWTRSYLQLNNFPSDASILN